MLKLENAIELVSINYEGDTINIKNYLGSINKFSIISVALSDALINGVLSRLLYECALHALIVMNYSDIEIEGMGAMKLYDLYDLMNTNGLIDTIESQIPKSELDDFFQYADAAYTEMLNTLNSGARTTENMVQEIMKILIAQDPEAVEKLAENLN